MATTMRQRQWWQCLGLCLLLLVTITNAWHGLLPSMSFTGDYPKPWWKHPTVLMTRFVARLAYDGTHFNGWQYQVKSRTVQLEVERALNATLAAGPAPSLLDEVCIRAVAAGRTDAGVHARGQVIHFDYPTIAAAGQTPFDFEAKLNARLPPDVRLWNVSYAPPPRANNLAVQGDWHAMYNSRGKLYTYRFSTRAVADPLQRRTWVAVPRGEELDVGKMAAMTSLFEGTHDYQNFANRLLHKRRSSKRGEEFTTRRTVESVDLVEEGVGEYRLDVRLDGALQRMVRNMVGGLWSVARGDMEESELRRALEGPMYPPGRSPIRAAPAHGLTCEWVYYDDY